MDGVGVGIVELTGVPTPVGVAIGPWAIGLLPGRRMPGLGVAVRAGAMWGVAIGTGMCRLGEGDVDCNVGPDASPGAGGGGRSACAFANFLSSFFWYKFGTNGGFMEDGQLK